MYKLKATFRIVTPMFIAGANQQQAELRAPSFKGALRFWWRALAYTRFGGNLDILRTEEARLFGSTDNAASFQIVPMTHHLKQLIPPATHPEFAHNNNKGTDRTGARYLAYGLMEAFGSKNKNKKAGQLCRACLDPDQFEVYLSSRKEFSTDIISAIKLLGLLGGLGSRTRRGFGSIALEKLSGDCEWTAPKTNEEYIREITEMLGENLLNQRPPYSAFSCHTRIDLLIKNEKSPYDVLNALGLRMIDYRSWGQSTRKNILPSGKVSEKRFKDDHDWYKKKKEWRKLHPTFHPQRVFFGLPHNYSRETIDHVRPEIHERRSSPLFFHVHQLGDKFIGVSTLFKSDFLPNIERDNERNTEKIRAGDRIVDLVDGWNILEEFIDGNEGNPRGTNPRKRFPNAKNILLCGKEATL